MNERIQKYSEQIQIEKDIEILLACETGSRAWGFPSPDSDFDVRFIYRHKKNWYLSLFVQKDTIELMYENNEIDLSGWDLKKTLSLLWKSNPPLLERLQSPILYISNKEFLSGMNELSKSTYSKIATMHHYLNMAKKVFEEVKDMKEVKLKKLFYALRSSIACKWILEQETAPPIEFHIMLDHLEITSELKTKIYELSKLKSTKSEAYLHNEEKELNILIQELIIEGEKKANSLPTSKGNLEDLNNFFIQMLSTQ